VHELSIAASIVEAVTEVAAGYPGARVKSVRLRIGVLAAVVEDSLRFCWDLAADGTSLAGAALVVKSQPLVVHCAACARDSQIGGVQSFRCPLCGRPCADLRHGSELEIESIELEEPDPDEPLAHPPQTSTHASTNFPRQGEKVSI